MEVHSYRKEKKIDNISLQTCMTALATLEKDDKF